MTTVVGTFSCGNKYSVIIGDESCGTAECTTTLGSRNDTSAGFATAIGHCNTVGHTGAVVIGYCTTSERAETVHVNHIMASGQGASKIHAIGSTGGASAVVDWDNGNNQTVTLTSNTTFAFCNPICGANYAIILTQGSGGSKCVTWPASVEWPSCLPPTLSTTAGQKDVVTFLYDGTDYYGSVGYNFG
jgi:hypothetical protein